MDSNFALKTYMLTLNISSIYIVPTACVSGHVECRFEVYENKPQAGSHAGERTILRLTITTMMSQSCRMPVLQLTIIAKLLCDLGILREYWWRGKIYLNRTV